MRDSLFRDDSSPIKIVKLLQQLESEKEADQAAGRSVSPTIIYYLQSFFVSFLKSDIFILIRSITLLRCVIEKKEYLPCELGESIGEHYLWFATRAIASKSHPDSLRTMIDLAFDAPMHQDLLTYEQFEQAPFFRGIWACMQEDISYELLRLRNKINP